MSGRPQRVRRSPRDVYENNSHAEQAEVERALRESLKSKKPSDHGPSSLGSGSGFGTLCDACGTPLLLCVFTVYFAQGFRSLGGLGMSYYLKDTLQLSATQSALITSWSVLPWSLKPLFGITSDCLPLGGRRRKPYVTIAAVLGVCAWTWLANTVADSGASGGGGGQGLLLLCMFMGNMSTALSDVVVDALVAEKSRDLAAASSSGSDAAAGEEALDAMLQNGCWTAMAAGGLAASALGFGLGVGSAGSAISLRTVCLITAACPLLVGLAALRIDEPRVAVAEGSALAAAKAKINQLCHALRSPLVYRPMGYVFLSGALAPSFDTPLFYFATERLGVTPDFSSASMALMWAAMMVGSLLFQRFFSAAGQHRAMFFWSQVGLAVCNLLTLAQVLGISDALLPTVDPKYFMVGADVLATMASRFSMMPFLVMAASLCPPGIEGTLFAAFMSIANFSNEVSRFSGAHVAAALNIGAKIPGAAAAAAAVAATNGTAAAAAAVEEQLDFSMLPHALVLRTVLMLVPLLFLTALVPASFEAPKMPSDDVAEAGTKTAGAPATATHKEPQGGRRTRRIASKSPAARSKVSAVAKKRLKKTE